MSDREPASDAVFERRIMEATGLTIGDVIALGEAQEQDERDRIQAMGHCCWAGAVASPGPCSWHSHRVDQEKPR